MEAPAGSETGGGLSLPTGSKRPEAVRVWLLGGFRITVGSRTIEDSQWRLRKAAALVKVLALAPSHRLHREQAIELLWPDSGAKVASNSLRQVLHAARRVLDPATRSLYLASEGESLVLCPEGELWVDVDAFEKSVATARRIQDSAAYQTAIELYTGELLPEDRYEGWASDRREQLRRVYLELLVELAGLYAQRKEYVRAIETLRKVVVEEPTNEEACAGLMRAYVLCGRPGEALAQYERLHDAFSRELGKEPSQTTRALRDEIAAGRFVPSQRTAPAPEQPPDSSKHNLPAPRTTFVGREREMVEIKRSLAMTSLLTLTGTGGCGKTRLALEVARDLIGAYLDGVWIVELAPLSEGEAVPQALATTLGVREQPGSPLLETLLRTLRDKRMLLILDNCEHLIDASTHLAEALLDSCPSVRVLSTSREPLGMTDELNWLVPSLSVPDAQHSPTLEELQTYESARLFADRASMRHPGFELTPENAQAVAQVCARLEGIPLAIELAAARIGLLSAEQISERLERPLTLLTRGDRTADRRHQTLRATLDWSYELLDESERVLFGRLSAFAGGFTLEAAESVGAGGDIEAADVLELLSMLGEKSLVVADESWQNGARYRLLEPVRQYAREKLKESREREQTSYRHAYWCLALAEEADRESSGPDHARWLDRLETEHDNLRAALEWSLEEGDAVLSLRLAGALWLFWFTRGYSTEGWRWLEKAISLGGPPAPRAKALNGAGWIVMFQGDFETAKTVLEESLTLYRELNDEEGIASSLSFLGHVALLGHRDDIPVADLLEEALTLRPRLENRRTIANMLVTAGIAAGLVQGDLVEAAALFEEAHALYREMEDKWGIITCLVNLGLLAVISEHHARAKALLREVMHLSRELDEKIGSVYSFFGLACAAALEGQPARAARLWGTSEAVQEAAGIEIVPSTYTVTRYESRLTEARDRLGEAAFEEAWAQGKAMKSEEAVEYALSEGKSAPLTLSELEERPSEPLSMLTRREKDVGTLVAKELSNRQIATELMLSEHTVATHVRHILKKLGLRSRTQISACFRDHQPLP